ncbi:MAG TPA: MFS transporter [Polyangiaceae bacterium]|nr:MFS transporter [Polyangiaceae bacterium]
MPASLETRQLNLLGVVALALLFEEYDSAMLISALKHIAHDLGIAEAELGLYLGLIRLGALPAFFCMPLADRFGRRPIFIFSTLALGLVTFATAFAENAAQFIVLQALARTFFITGTTAGFVIITEEFPAEHRGWGTGMLAALGALGHGLSAGLFSQIERLPFGWRALYVVGVVPVFCLPLFLRRIRESQRFVEHQRELGVVTASLFAAVLGPMRALFVTQPLRAAVLALCGVLLAAATLPSFQFSGFFTQEKLGWKPSHYSIMVISGGAVGILGNIAAGRFGDLFGRKRVGIVLLAAFPIASFAFYRSSSWVVALAWVPLVFCFMGGRVILKALSAELFPTSHRSAAAGLFAVMEALGAVVGMFVVYSFRGDATDQLSTTVPLIALAVLGTAALLLTFPETTRRELEEIAR